MEAETFGTNDIITGRGLGIGGFGGFGNYGNGIGASSVLRESALADGTAMKASLDCHSAQFNAGLDRVSAQSLETRTSLKLAEILKGQSDAEFRSLDRQRDIEKVLVEGQKENASCCCETQKLIVAESARTRDLINNNTIATLNRQLSDCKCEKNAMSGVIAAQTAMNFQTNTLLNAIENSKKK